MNSIGRSHGSVTRRLPGVGATMLLLTAWGCSGTGAATVGMTVLADLPAPIVTGFVKTVASGDGDGGYVRHFGRGRVDAQEDRITFSTRAEVCAQGTRSSDGSCLESVTMVFDRRAGDRSGVTTRLTAERPLPGRSSYLIGDDSSRWRHDVVGYDRLRYRDVHDGIDLVVEADAGGPKLTWIVEAGADPGAIGWRYDETATVEVDPDGALDVRTNDGSHAPIVREEPPVAWQDGPGGRREVAVRYRVVDGRIDFALGSYDRSRPLVIDPLVAFVGVLGHEMDDRVVAMTANDAGEVFVVGDTISGRFPAPGSPTPTPGPIDLGRSDVFVSKLDADGTVLKTVFLGGSGRGSSNSYAADVIVDSEGYVIVTGHTFASTFPNTDRKGPGRRVLQPGLAEPSSPSEDVFVTKLDFDSDDELQTGPESKAPYRTFSTYLGGSRVDRAAGLALDASGDVVVAMSTSSTDVLDPVREDVPRTPKMPIEPVAQAVNAGGTDGLVVTVNTDGSQVVWGSYFGGGLDDELAGVAPDAEGGLWVVGRSRSTNLCRPAMCEPGDVPAPPLSGARISAGADADGFLARIADRRSGGAMRRIESLAWLGGSGEDEPAAVAISDEGRVAVVGETLSESLLGLGTKPRSGFADAFAAEVVLDGDRLDLVWADAWGADRQRDRALAVRYAEVGTLLVGGESPEGSMPLDARYPGDVASAAAELSVYLPDGRLIERYRLATSAGGYSSAAAMALEPGGRLWIGGTSRGRFSAPQPSPPPHFAPARDDGFVAAVDGLPYPTATTTPSATPTVEPTRTTPPTATLTPEPRPPTATPTKVPEPLYLPILVHDRCPPIDIFADVVLVVDASTSMDETTPSGERKIEAAVRAALAFVEGDLRLYPGGERVAIVTLNSEPTVLQPLTSDRPALRDAIARIPNEIRLGSRIGAGIDAAAGLLAADPRLDATRSIVLMTDGRANGEPDEAAADAARAARVEGMLMYVVGVGRDIDRARLRAMASDAARYFPAPDVESLVPIYEDLVRRTQCPKEVYWGRR